ncbi:multidrug efflux SMR transporter [Serratia sp. JSRIV001]|uniref:DMT family transporter n=1 Tax=Serratia TaxID=613 RepID=UPI0003FBB20D|nr:MULTISPECIES: multidrug efflux SMR transporter [Serratia]UAN45138.1 multidrug efflux SMR transporter [Serratia sp. JSRIV001]UAN50645.1 multidrug efflux SMR transporter [Serratia sp. JSRIV002]UAN56602.1 multidrug efflux SMR transporter [Serratia sp. JSRIV004]UAN62209.1 multidrug efflux SMR transporter [Serratia sp. JSRIV006]
MKAYLLLAIAIGAEVVATTSMKAMSGLSKPIPLMLVIVGYSIAFWMLSIVVQTIPVGIAYATWAGLGIVFVSIASFYIYGQRLDFSALIGMGLIILGVIVVQVFSKTAGH